MGAMNDYREELKLPDLSMQYEDGGKFEVYSFKGKKVRLEAPVSSDQVKQAIKAALND